MIGHDIIDLNYQDHPSRWKEERYWRKVLVKEELAWLKKQDNPFRVFLICWAIKEAAYKMVCNITPKHLFIPKKFIINELGNIKYYDSIYFILNSPIGELVAKVRTNSTFIQATVSLDKGLLHQSHSQVFPLAASGYPLQSSETRKVILKHFSSRSSFDQRNLEIRKRNSLPALYISGNEAPIDISISHHGHWGSFAYVDSPI
ncbi:MAG: 4'-phosphopantetheinyl transferase superfamily protein [Bacteroidota bacterium]